MTVTRVIAETVIVKRLGPLMSAADMVVTVAGTNADLNDPLAWAARQLDLTTADPSTITDIELASLSDGDVDAFFNLVEWRTLSSILTNLDDVDITAGPRSEKLSQLAAQVQARLDRLEPTIVDYVSPLSTGYIQLDIAEHNELRTTE